MIVNPARRMFSAISFGVFCRSAPSTKAIMRSRKVSPGLDVIFTLIRSDRTRVPPVTAERSPPATRLANHGRRLTRDRRFVYRSDAFGDLAIRGNKLAGRAKYEF